MLKLRSLLAEGHLAKALDQLAEERRENPNKSKELTDLVNYFLYEIIMI